jgi:hypothetical protein
MDQAEFAGAGLERLLDELRPVVGQYALEGDAVLAKRLLEVV